MLRVTGGTRDQPLLVGLLLILMSIPFPALAEFKPLPMPGLDVRLALRQVRDEVLKAMRNRQERFKHGLLGGPELPLVPGATPASWSTTERQWQQYSREA